MRSPCVGRLLETVVPGPYGQPTRLPDMIVSDLAVRAMRSAHVVNRLIQFWHLHPSNSLERALFVDHEHLW